MLLLDVEMNSFGSDSILLETFLSTFSLRQLLSLIFHSLTLFSLLQRPQLRARPAGHGTPPGTIRHLPQQLRHDLHLQPRQLRPTHAFRHIHREHRHHSVRPSGAGGEEGEDLGGVIVCS